MSGFYVKHNTELKLFKMILLLSKIVKLYMMPRNIRRNHFKYVGRILIIV